MTIEIGGQKIAYKSWKIDASRANCVHMINFVVPDAPTGYVVFHGPPYVFNPEKESEYRMGIFEPDPHDFYGQLIGLQATIKEFHNEVTKKPCEEHPLLVTMAIADLRLRVDEIIDSMKQKMAKKMDHEIAKPFPAGPFAQ